MCDDSRRSPPPPLISSLSQVHKKQNLKSKKHEIKIDYYHAVQMLILSLGVFTLLRPCLCYLCTHVNYVTFNTNLNLYSKEKTLLISTEYISAYLSLFALSLILSECEKEQIVLIISINIKSAIGNVTAVLLRCNKIIARISGTLPLYIFCISTTPATCILCLVIIQIWCHLYVKRVTRWLPIILIILSNDINLNPGPHHQNNLFNFMSWNVNSLAQDNFQRVRLIEAHNSIFNYDLISICETSLKDSVELPECLLKDYTFISANNPMNTRNGGVGLFYKNSLPVIVRNDLSFDESIVLELKFGRKKIFFTVLYRTPSYNHTSPEFQDFCQNLKPYIQISKLKILLQYFLQVILMHTLSCGGLMATQIRKARKLMNFSLS